MPLETGRVAQRILELAKNPEIVPPETEQEERAEVEPDRESPIAGDKVALEPPYGMLRSGLDLLENKTVWAIDGGALSVELPIGRLIVGRAVVLRMAFHGYETVKRELIVPALPFFVCGGAASKDIPEATALYLTKAIQLIPSELEKGQRRGPVIDFFSDGEAYLDKFQDSWSGATHNQVQVARAIDVARNAAETVAFQTALRLAKPGNLVLRDGRLHGSVAFWTTLFRLPSEDTKSPAKNSQLPQEALQALETFIKDVQDAIRRDVRVVGIIKRPVSDECCVWLRNKGMSFARYASDAILYLRACENLTTPEPKFGKRSTLWRYKPYKPQQQILTPRMKLEEFRRSVAFYYIVPGLGASPFRVDIPTYYDKYHSWYDEVAHQVYTLARGSGSPSRIPHPIVIADAYARVHRAEAMRFLHSLIAEFERLSDPEARILAKEIRVWTSRGK